MWLLMILDVTKVFLIDDAQCYEYAPNLFLWAHINTHICICFIEEQIENTCIGVWETEYNSC